MSDYLWKALLTEFLGTFTLVFVGAGAVALTAAQGGSLVVSGFAFGLVLMTLIYTWGSYSGAHFNPAVSFGFAVAGRMNWWLMIGYWIAQLLGGIAAGALIAYFFGTDNGAGASVGSFTNTDAWKAILLEAFLTFFLVITYLFITRNPFLAIASGLAIGMVLTFAMFVGGPLTGASMNPARSLGPAIFSSNMGTYWIYIVGPLVGALVAALVYKLFTIDWSCCDKVDDCGNVVLDACGNPLKECERPLVDACGNPVKVCGEVQYEKYTRVERKIGHHQETILGAVGGWLGAHGMSPRYMMQEMQHAGVGDKISEQARALMSGGDASLGSLPVLNSGASAVSVGPMGSVPAASVYPTPVTTATQNIMSPSPIASIPATVPTATVPVATVPAATVPVASVPVASVPSSLPVLTLNA